MAITWTAAMREDVETHQFFRLPPRIARKTDARRMAADSLSCVAVGTGLALEHMDILRDSLEEP